MVLHAAPVPVTNSFPCLSLDEKCMPYINERYPPKAYGATNDLMSNSSEIVLVFQEFVFNASASVKGRYDRDVGKIKKASYSESYFPFEP